MEKIDFPISASYRFRSRPAFRALFALLLSMPLATCNKSQSNGTPTGDDGPLWNVPKEAVYFGGPAIGPDGTIYIGTSEAGVSDTLTTHGLYAVDRNGRTKWKYTTGKSIKSSPVIGPDGTIYIMVGIGTDTDANGLDSSLHAIDPQGQKKWECPNLGSFGVGPVPDSPAIAKDGTIYVSGAHDLFALQNGCKIKWSYHFPDLDNVLSDGTRYHLSSLRSSPSVGDDGTVYVNTLEGPIRQSSAASMHSSPRGSCAGITRVRGVYRRRSALTGPSTPDTDPTSRAERRPSSWPSTPTARRSGSS